MERLTFFLFACMVLAVGCSDFDGPDSGTWFYQEVTPAQNTCGANASALYPSGNFEIENSEDGSFIVIPASGGQFVCELNGYDYTCPERSAGEISESGSTISWRAHIDGTFDSQTRASGTQRGSVTCEGSACPVVEASFGVNFPCEIEVDFIVVKR